MSALCRECLWSGAPPAGARRCPGCHSPRLLVHDELNRLTMAHLDCDAFYASVEKRDRPELRDRPVIVGGGKRGVVATCCYIARMSGVRSAMPMFKALGACPDAVVVKPDFAKYSAESRRIMAMMGSLTPLVQPLSLDEAWMDLSGTERINGGSPAMTLARLQARIEAETGLTVSIGLAANKFLAKIASDLDKPRGFAVIGAAEAKAFLASRPVGILPGVGPALVASLEKIGLRTVGEIAEADLRDLAARFGEYGLRLHQLAHAQDARQVNPDSVRKSISAETTFHEDIRGLAELEDQLWPLCEKVARKCRATGVVGQVATLKLKTTDFRLVSRRRTLPIPTQTARVLFGTMKALLREQACGEPYRLIGAGLSGFIDAGGPSDLFADNEVRALKSEQAIDALRAKFGAAAVVSGRTLKPRRETL